MFAFVVKYFGFLKAVPGMGLVFDAWLRIITVLFNPAVSDYIDNIETELFSWPNIRVGLHQYGGLQFDYGALELGHIHSNGLLDIPLSRKLKQQLIAQDGRVQDHHLFKNTGWISFYIKTEDDAAYALRLLKMAYHEKASGKKYQHSS